MKIENRDSPRGPSRSPAHDSAPRYHHHRSGQALAVSIASRLIVKNAVRAWAWQPDLAWPFESIDQAAGLLTGHRPSRIRRVKLDTCAAEWIPGADRPTERAILYLHGGAFLTCGLNTHRTLVTRLSAAAGAGVLNIGYRMLPAHPVSDAIEDALNGFRWLRRRGFAADKIVVAGDSAGGYLAFMTTLAAIRRRFTTPAGIATISPLTDTDPLSKLGHPNAHRCSMFPSGALPIFSRYLRRSRVASPVDADLSQLPPVAIHASSDELLLPDAELMTQRLTTAGVRCDLHLWDGQIHDFPLAADILPEGRRAIRYLGEFIRDVTGAAGPDAAAA